MHEVADKSGTCQGIGTGEKGSDRVPIAGSGIGTRLGEVADVIGKRSDAAEAAGVSPAALQRYIGGKNMPPFDAVARLCLAANVRMEWVATGIGEMKANPWEPAPEQASQAVRREDLMMAMQLASESLGNKVLSPADHAELVSLLYELLVEGLPQATVLRFARKAAGV